MPTVTLANGRSFESGAERTMLDAARQADLVLEHSCRTGRCGSCKAKVVSGRTTALKPDLALQPAEKADGWVLTCTTAAVDDVQIDIEDLGLPIEVQPRTLPCRIDSLQHLAPDILQLVLRLPPNATFRHVAGQYIDLIGKAGLRRSYSLANVAGADSKLELHIRRVDEGVMSAHLFGEAKPGDLLRLEGPLGTFFLRDVAGLDLVFLATGTGFAPVKAMLARLAEAPAFEQPRSVTLYWGARHAEDLYWAPADELPWLRYVPVLSRADGSWSGVRGHVQDALLADRPDWSRAAVYACGSPAMIDDARAALTTAGLPPRRFKADAFVSSN